MKLSHKLHESDLRAWRRLSEIAEALGKPGAAKKDWKEAAGGRGFEAMVQRLQDTHCVEYDPRQKIFIPKHKPKTQDYTQAPPPPDPNAPAPAWVDELNLRHAVVNFGGKTVIADTSGSEIQFFRFLDFLGLYANKYPPLKFQEGDEKKQPTVAELWWRHPERREYLCPGVVFEPSANLQTRLGALNLWRGFAVEPKPDDWSLMKTHILTVLAAGNEDHARYILDWMAYCVQHPERQAEVALSFQGEPGCGKGVVWRHFGGLFGPHFRHFNDPDQITGRFNGNLGQSVFVLLDEALWGGDRRAEGKLKALITEPTLQIERKGLERMEVPNRLSIVACSNEDWAVPVGLGDRRWACFGCDNRWSYKNATQAERKAHFDPLYAQMANGGQAAMLFDLLRRKVTAGDIRDNAPNTVEKARLKIMALRSTEQWLYGLLEEGELPDIGEVTRSWETPIDKDRLYEDYLEFCSRHHKHVDVLIAWSRKVKEILGNAVNLEHRESLPRGKLGPRQTKFGPLELCRVRFDQYLGNCPNGEHWAPALSPAEARRRTFRVVPEDEPVETAPAE
jgi:Family of unknown function (DUF5906)